MRYRVFISSTIDDLQTERERIDTELSATEIFEVIRVEKLPAAGEPSGHVCLDEIARADVVVLILSTRYGFIPERDNPSALSVTHLEYREGKRLSKPIFAFVKQDGIPEPALEKLIREVSNFDKGVLRKEWRSLEELQREVRRSLLFWLAREARTTHSKVHHEQTAAQLARFSDVGELSVTFAFAEMSGEDLQAWQEEFLKQLDVQCRRHVLPLPRRREQAVVPGTRPALSLDIRPGSSAERFRASIAVWRSEASLANKGLLIPPVELDALRTPEGARLAADAALGLVLVRSDDILRGIDQLFTVAEGLEGTSQSRENILGAAAYVSAVNKGERCFEVGRQLLKLPSLQPSTVTAGILCFLAAQARYEHARARHALAQTERLALQLLIVSLSRSPGAPDVLYNLARQSLKYSPQLALEFYQQLLRAEPSYDERWYFHRDIGLLRYQAENYQEAARHYDQACHLRNYDSELWRFAGDANYYSGEWAEALLRYEKALGLETMEDCFLDTKIAFARARIHEGVAKDRAFVFRRFVSHKVSNLGISPAKAGIAWVAKPFFSVAKFICEMNFEADNWFALYENRRGSYIDAIRHLKGALVAVPEDPSTRVNLVVNLIFQNNGEFGEDARIHARIAIFHGGPETRDQFRLRLTNTSNREVLCRVFAEIFDSVKREREAWRERRLKILGPERFGQIVHMEWRP